MSKDGPVLVWFRQDLRLADNPALSHAASLGRVIPVFICDEIFEQLVPTDCANRWWLERSLDSLNKALGNRLVVRFGKAEEVLAKLIAEHRITAVCWNRVYEPDCIIRDKTIKKSLTEQGVEVYSFNGYLLREPWEVLKPDRTWYRVYTAFFKNGYAGATPQAPIPKPSRINWFFPKGKAQSNTAEWPASAGVWSSKFEVHWQPGESGARHRMESFIERRLTGYQRNRDSFAVSPVSGLSPHLRFGEISPRQILHNVSLEAAHDGLEDDLHAFHRELVWRDFCVYQLYHRPDILHRNLIEKFDRFPWQKNRALMTLWQKGQTGFPLVDAAMRELWETGYMHNRARMITASFLVKNLMIDWREGERWFRYCLLDADPASNCANWQWVAGCGLDAAPYFRIFNPLTQSRKFDPEGNYIRRFLPELAGLTDRLIHEPDKVASDVLESAGVVLGETYPQPIVDLKQSREKALQAFRSL